MADSLTGGSGPSVVPGPAVQGPTRQQTRTVGVNDVGEVARPERENANDEASKNVSKDAAIGLRLQFDKSEETGETVIRVFDKDTGDLIRQVPEADLQDFLRNRARTRLVDSFV